MEKRGLNIEADSFIGDYEEHVEKQYGHVKETAWNNEVSRDNRKTKYGLNKTVAKSALERLKYFVSLIDDYERNLPKSKTFIELLVNLVREHIKTSKEYLNTEDWYAYPSLYENNVAKQQEDEMEFQNSILEDINKFNVEIRKLNLDNEIREIVIPIFGDKLAPFLMSNIFRNRFPKVDEYLEQKGKLDVFNNNK